MLEGWGRIRDRSIVLRHAVIPAPFLREREREREREIDRYREREREKGQRGREVEREREREGRKARGQDREKDKGVLPILVLFLCQYHLERIRVENEQMYTNEGGKWT